MPVSVRRRRFHRVLSAGTAGLLTAGLLPAILGSPAWAAPHPSKSAATTADAQESDGQAPTEDAALEQAKRTGREVEVSSLRSESADVVATADGKLQARQYLRPVRTRMSGQWKDIDTDLAGQSNGTVAPKATAVGLAFSGGGDKPLVTMRKAGRELALSWPGTLPARFLTARRPRTATCCRTWTCGWGHRPTVSPSF